MTDSSSPKFANNMVLGACVHVLVVLECISLHFAMSIQHQYSFFVYNVNYL